MNILKSIGVTIIIVAMWISSMLLGYIFAIIGTIFFISFIVYNIISAINDKEISDIFSKYE